MVNQVGGTSYFAVDANEVIERLDYPNDQIDHLAEQEYNDCGRVDIDILLDEGVGWHHPCGTGMSVPGFFKARRELQKL